MCSSASSLRDAYKIVEDRERATHQHNRPAEQPHLTRAGPASASPIRVRLYISKYVVGWTNRRVQVQVLNRASSEQRVVAGGKVRVFVIFSVYLHI